MKLTLTIDSDNAAFDEAADEGRSETARLLRVAADRIEGGHDSGGLVDSNGNKVGEFDFEPQLHPDFQH